MRSSAKRAAPTRAHLSPCNDSGPNDPIAVVLDAVGAGAAEEHGRLAHDEVAGGMIDDDLRVVVIADLAARVAEDVVVQRRVGIEAHGRAGVGNFAREPELGQCFERAVYRGFTHAFHSLENVCVNRVHRRVICATEEHLEHRATLHRDRETGAFAAHFQVEGAQREGVIGG